MHDDDFDRRRTDRGAALDMDVERPKIPGKQTLVEAEGRRSTERPSSPGKRTLVEQAYAQHAQAEGPDPATEVEFHVRKAHEMIAKLAAKPPPADEQIARADLRRQLDEARRLGAQCGSDKRGRDAIAAMFEVVLDAMPFVDVTRSKSPEAIAQRGIEGPGQPLPHRDEVQRQFGPHDLAGVRAHVGGAAADASRELGAHGYTHGNDIAFAEDPTPALVAHEATHVIQQRAGVSLKSMDGGAGDPHEQQADAVAAAVARGESAAPILDAIPRGPAGNAVVQRKSGDTSAATPHAGDPPTVKAAHGKWPVFSDTSLPYKIASARDPVRFWTVSDWIRAGAGFQASGVHARSPACAGEIIRALGWVREERIELAARNMVFDISRSVVGQEPVATAFYFLGMPTSAPIVERAGHDLVYVVTRLDDPNVPPGTRVEADDAQRLQVVRALADFTGLTPDARALDNLRRNPRLQQFVVYSGVLRWDIGDEIGNDIFGYDETSDSKSPFSRWLRGNQGKEQPASKGPEAPKLKLHDFYGEPIPGALKPDRELIEAGQPVWFEVAVNWPKDYPRAKDFDVVPMVTPGHAGEVSLLKCHWEIELVGSGAATVSSAPAGTTSTASAAADSAANGGGSIPGSAVAAPAIVTSAKSTMDTDVAELHPTFVLPPGQDKGKFRVTVRASFDEYFEPAEFTRTVDVSSTAAAMKQLGNDAFADFGARETSRTKESFDASGSGDDNHGYRTAGELPASFKPSTLDGPAPRAAAREGERKRLEATRMYLEANGAREDVLAAVDRELETSRATEAALASDRTRGWQPFQIRGTYLSREDGVPSGSLTLYGSVHADIAPGLEIHKVKQTPDRGIVVVQIRDLSRRFDNEDMAFTGRGETFESALKDAFTDNAKAYPKGVMAIEAEAIATRVEGSTATIGKGNGKTVGFELGTDSRWKRVSAEVWKPVVNVATNLGAMALMAFVPGSAVVVAPLLIAYNSIPAADRLRTESERGTLTLGTAATSVGEIALNLLPLVGKAKAFTSEWFLIESANWGGQAVLMTASALHTARALQGQDVEALAGMYEELQKLEASGADPAAIEAKRQQVMERAKGVSDRIAQQLQAQIATNAMFAVAGSVIHRAGVLNEAGRTKLIDSYLTTRGAGGGEPDATAGAVDHGTPATTKNSSDTGQEDPRPTTSSSVAPSDNEFSPGSRHDDKGPSGDKIENGPPTKTDNQLTLGEHEHLVKTGSARDEADMIKAIKEGKMPRFIARVGKKSLSPSFANARRPFIFATEPSDLRGIPRAAAMAKVGWTKEWIVKSVGEEIEVTIFDTESAIPGEKGVPAAKVEMGRMEWAQLKELCTKDPAFLKDAADRGLTRDDMIELFDHMNGKPLAEAEKTATPAQIAKLKTLQALLDSSYGVNNLYTGRGYTADEQGNIGGREVMVKPNGTGLKLTPDNHVKVPLGVLTKADVDAYLAGLAKAGGSGSRGKK